MLSPPPLGTSMDTESSLNILLMVMVLLTCMFMGFVLEKTHTLILGESGAALLIGVGSGYLLLLLKPSDTETGSELLVFDNNAFFNFLLPPIIFSAGYTMRKRRFFQNFGTIALLGVFGTMVVSITIAVCLHLVQKVTSFLVPLTAIDCLTLGTVLSNVDLVAPLSLLNPAETPVLYSIMFGEGVLNDAVSIVLFDATQEVTDVDDFIRQLVTILLRFVWLLFASTAVGVVSGLLCSLFFKRTKVAEDNKRAIALFLMFGYSSYLVAEVLHLSGIMSIFFCGVVLAHYNWYNLSPTARTATSATLQSISYAAEMFVFAYMGFSMWTLTFASAGGVQGRWDPVLIIVSTVSMMLARLTTPLLFVPLANRFRRPSERIKGAEATMMYFAGIMRGAIAFALAMATHEEERSVIATTVLAVAMITTFIFGGINPYLMRALGLTQGHGGHAAPPVVDRAGSITAPLLGGAAGDDALEAESEHVHPSFVERDDDRGSPPAAGAADSTPQLPRTIDGIGGQVTASGQEAGAAVRKGGGGRAHRLWKDWDDRFMKNWFGGQKRKASEREAERLRMEDELAVAREQLAFAEQRFALQRDIVKQLTADLTEMRIADELLEQEAEEAFAAKSLTV